MPGLAGRVACRVRECRRPAARRLSRMTRDRRRHPRRPRRADGRSGDPGVPHRRGAEPGGHDVTLDLHRGVHHHAPGVSVPSGRRGPGCASAVGDADGRRSCRATSPTAHPGCCTATRCSVVDLYDPMHLEQLEQLADRRAVGASGSARPHRPGAQRAAGARRLLPLRQRGAAPSVAGPPGGARPAQPAHLRARTSRLRSLIDVCPVRPARATRR